MVWPITWEGLSVEATILGAKLRRVNALQAKLTFNSPPNRLAESASRSERTPRTRMPREYPPACRSDRAAAGTDSTRRTSAPPPSAIGPARCHVRCCASQENGRCGEHADLAGLPRRHNHGRLIHNQDDGAVVLALSARMGLHQPVRGLAASRYDWLRSVEWREEPRDRRRLDGASCPAWPGRLEEWVLLDFLRAPVRRLFSRLRRRHRACPRTPLQHAQFLRCSRPTAVRQASLPGATSALFRVVAQFEISSRISQSRNR